MIGKNGAGKTTFFQIITGNLDTDSGTVILNNDIVRPEKFEQKRKIGYLPQHLSLPRWVTATELVRYSLTLHGINPGRLSEILTYWHCEHYKDRPLSACSHGMQKRVGLAIATLHQPTLLILDEPFSGLDIFHIKALENKISQRRQQGLLTILSTHLIPYAAKLCNKACLMKEGKIIDVDEWKTSDISKRTDLIETHFFSNSPLPMT